MFDKANFKFHRFQICNMKMSIDSKNRMRKCLTEQTFNSVDSKDRIRKHLFFMSIINLLGTIWRNEEDDDDGAGHNSRVARYLIPKEVGTVPDQELLEDFTNSESAGSAWHPAWYNPHHPHHWQKNNVLSAGITNIDSNCFSFCAMNVWTNSIFARIF